MGPRIYLRVGDRVKHLRYDIWGCGEVVEEKHSSLEGGLYLARILFEDGIERSFINNMDNECCCYYAGVRII